MSLTGHVSNDLCQPHERHQGTMKASFLGGPAGLAIGIFIDWLKFASVSSEIDIAISIVTGAFGVLIA